MKIIFNKSLKMNNKDLNLIFSSQVIKLNIYSILLVMFLSYTNKTDEDKKDC